MELNLEDHDPQMDEFECTEEVPIEDEEYGGGDVPVHEDDSLPPVDEQYPPQPPANQQNQQAQVNRSYAPRQANQQYQRPRVNRTYAPQPAVNQAFAIGMTLLNQLPQMMDEEYQFTDEAEEVPMDEEIHFPYDQEYDGMVNGEEPLPAENQQEPTLPMNQPYASPPVNQRNQRVQVNRSYAPRNANQQYRPVNRSYVPQPPVNQQPMMEDTGLNYDENDFPYGTEEHEGEDDQYFPEVTSEEQEAYNISEGDEYQQPTPPENQQDPLQPVNQQSQRARMNQQSQQTRMNQQSQRTRMSQQNQRTRVNQQNPRTQVNQQSQRLQVNQHGQRPQFNQQGERAQVSQQSQRTQVNQQNSRSQVNQQSQQPQVNQQGQRPQGNQQGQRAQVNQQSQRPQVNQHNQGRVHPSTQVKQQTQAAVGQQPRYNPPSPATGRYPQAIPQGQGVWSTDLFDCFNDVPLCCLTFWCPCITFGRIAEIVEKGSSTCNTSGGTYALTLLLTGCHFIYSGAYRTKMRLEYGIPGDDAEDFCTHFWCESCALVQEYNELTTRGYNVPLGWQGNINIARLKQAQGVQMAPKAPNGMTR